MKKPRTKVQVFIGKEAHLFSVPSRTAEEILAQLRRDGKPVERDTIPADEVFADLDAKYTKPGVALQGFRLKAGLTQVELAEKLETEQTNVSKMEKGTRPIGKAMAKRLAEILDVDYRVFL